jgi:hypothetical protein
MADQGHDGNDGNGDDQPQKKAMSIGLAAAYGAAAGTVVFAITGNPIWIAIGPAIGVAFAAMFVGNKKETD